jgi:hypothetical protein
MTECSVFRNLCRLWRFLSKGKDLLESIASKNQKLAWFGSWKILIVAKLMMGILWNAPSMIGGWWSNDDLVKLKHRCYFSSLFMFFQKVDHDWMFGYNSHGWKIRAASRVWEVKCLGIRVGQPTIRATFQRSPIRDWFCAIFCLVLVSKATLNNSKVIVNMRFWAYKIINKCLKLAFLCIIKKYKNTKFNPFCT